MNIRTTTYILLISIILAIQNGISQCPAGDLIIQNQAQVNYYVNQCPSVDTIHGALIIGDLNSDITDISGLTTLKVVTGGLTVQHNNSLQSLNGLDSITTIGGWMTISKNKQLESLAHLEGVTTINGSISINKNDELNNTLGLKNVISYNGDLTITENPKLINIKGFSNIQHATGDVRIHDNLVLTSFDGLNNLKSIQGDLTIQANESLKNIDGLDSLESIGNHCAISYNSSLSDLDAFAKLVTIGADLYIGSNSSLSDCAGICDLINKNGIGGSIAIGDNLSNCLNNSTLIPFCYALPTLSVVQPNLNISPNPAHQYLQINSDFTQEIKQIRILSLSGQLIMSPKNKNNRLDITDMSAGMYILALFTKDQVYYQNFVVN